MSQTELTYNSTSGSSQSQTEAHEKLDSFWLNVMDEIRTMSQGEFKNQELPLARIKKIMKLDEDVKMISAEAPVLFAKAAEIFINELSLRAWIHTEDNKRRTLQKNDIAMAITKYDQFDFLIDIVPRDELKPTKRQDDSVRTTAAMHPDQVQYYFQLAQQHQAALQQQNNTVATPQQQTVTQQAATPQIQIVQTSSGIQTMASTTPTLTVQTATPTFSVPSVLQVQTSAASSPQVLQLPQTLQQGQLNQTGGIQLVQQVINSNGEIQQIPIQLTPTQLQLIRMQMQGQAANSQPVIIQTSPLAQGATAQTVQQAAPQTVYQIQQVAQPGQGTATTATPVFLTSAGSGGAPTVQLQAVAQADHSDGVVDEAV
ncbi:nuclear transcription factor Y subunit gamma-like [Limulus polyphemus]|uniref:Nuclear transcription factor Y subunit gamma n=1 Tax=Limulus polyphemus TaxID=6850 RepID=A0ABM1BMQ3_LIMPO|nr:nuclear transcription factor Y subunit gamma-like [Limulus polyphemus]XP_013785109.1 nuclear transcription factor Y subunit gamma-like [Limulus polyphemus]XP_022253337.1 nuclear transcription factor Y subunit gamma-like [Limulus polyphemus]